MIQPRVVLIAQAMTRNADAVDSDQQNHSASDMPRNDVQAEAVRIFSGLEKRGDMYSMRVLQSHARVEGRVTSSKAVAGGIGGALVVIADWLLTLIPGWDVIPEQPKGAITFLVASGITAALVYWAPANRQTIQ